MDGRRHRRWTDGDVVARPVLLAGGLSAPINVIPPSVPSRPSMLHSAPGAARRVPLAAGSRRHGGAGARTLLVVDAVDMPATGWRVLGIGVDESIGMAAQDALRRVGLRATVITVTDDAAGDQRLREALAADSYDAVNLGAGLSGQAPPEYGATATSTVWFNRLLNIVHTDAPTARIVLARGPDDVLPAITRELDAR